MQENNPLAITDTIADKSENHRLWMAIHLQMWQALVASVSYQCRTVMMATHQPERNWSHLEVQYWTDRHAQLNTACWACWTFITQTIPCSTEPTLWWPILTGNCSEQSHCWRTDSSSSRGLPSALEQNFILLIISSQSHWDDQYGNQWEKSLCLRRIGWWVRGHSSP